jgi:16S rRNA (guanine527-N7)-methyltransferase
MALKNPTREAIHEALRKGLAKLGLDVNAAGQLTSYIAELDRWNQVYKFVKADRRRLVSHHVLDALIAAPIVQTSGPKIGDLGSGVGLPAIPLAITLPNHTFTLIERSEKRRSFLAAVVLLLRLNNVQICADAKGQYFDLLTARAVAPMVDLVQEAANHQLSRRLLIYAGKRKPIDDALPALQYPATVQRVRVPLVAGERHLVTINLDKSITPVSGA